MLACDHRFAVNVDVLPEQHNRPKKCWLMRRRELNGGWTSRYCAISKAVVDRCRTHSNDYRYFRCVMLCCFVGL